MLLEIERQQASAWFWNVKNTPRNQEKKIYIYIKKQHFLHCRSLPNLTPTRKNLWGSFSISVLLEGFLCSSFPALFQPHNYQGIGPILKHADPSRIQSKTVQCARPVSGKIQLCKNICIRLRQFTPSSSLQSIDSHVWDFHISEIFHHCTVASDYYLC